MKELPQRVSHTNGSTDSKQSVPVAVAVNAITWTSGGNMLRISPIRSKAT